MYKKTVKKMQDSFEIAKIFDQLKTSSLLADLTLSKYQKAMIPYFTSHLVIEDEKDKNSSTDEGCHDAINWTYLSKEKRDLIKKGLLQLVIGKEPSKVNQRILKNLTSKSFIKPKSSPLMHSNYENSSNFDSS